MALKLTIDIGKFIKQYTKKRGPFEIIVIGDVKVWKFLRRPIYFRAGSSRQFLWFKSKQAQQNPEIMA